MSNFCQTFLIIAVSQLLVCQCQWMGHYWYQGHMTAQHEHGIFPADSALELLLIKVRNTDYIPIHILRLGGSCVSGGPRNLESFPERLPV